MKKIKVSEEVFDLLKEFSKKHNLSIENAIENIVIVGAHKLSALYEKMEEFDKKKERQNGRIESKSN